LLSGSIAKAEEFDVSKMNWYPDPATGATQFVSPADTFVLAAPRAYLSVYGRWPSSWGEIQDSGLIQVPLCALKGVPINPDDMHYDGSWDKVYYAPVDGSPRIGLGITTLGIEQVMWLSKPQGLVTYDQRLRHALDPQSGYDLSLYEGFEKYVGNEPFQRLLGLCAMCEEGLMLYKQAYGHNPASWQQFVESGLAPIDSNSVNPLTGGRIFGDGRANDIHFETADTNHLALVYPTGPDGNRAWLGSL
jgi:hypothetical protein